MTEKEQGDSALASQSGRRYVRVELEVEVSMQSEDNFYAGLMENLSVSGLFVATHSLQPVGHRVALVLRLPGIDDPVSLLGVVRWHRRWSETSDVSPGMGLEFVDLTEAARSLVDRFVRNRLPLLYDDDP